VPDKNPLILSIDVIYNNEPVKLLNLKVASPGIFQAFIHPLSDKTKLESGTELISADDIYLPYYKDLESLCKNASKNIFLSLFIRANSIKESLINDVDELNTAFIINNGSITKILNSEASKGYEELFMQSFDKLKEMNADWGVLTEFGTDNETGKQGIIVEVAHPDFGKIFITTVTFNKKLNSINVGTFDTKVIQEGAGAKWKEPTDDSEAGLTDEQYNIMRNHFLVTG